MNIFLDDLRDAHDHYNIKMVTIRNYFDFCEFINQNGVPDFISFDHDIASFENGKEYTGLDAAKYLVNYMLDNNIQKKFDFVVHSANPIGAENIKSYLENYLNYLN